MGVSKIRCLLVKSRPDGDELICTIGLRISLKLTFSGPVNSLWQSLQLHWRPLFSRHQLFRNYHQTTQAMNEIKSVKSTVIPLLLDDIDTDRIIPARFLRCVTFDGLGEHAFEDDRKQDANHPFDKPQFQGAGILVAGRNFGCGSSREHAPQSLMRWGIKAIIAESFAEIFFGNCGSLGIPAVKAARADLDKLGAAVEANPKLEVTVDLESLTVSAAGVSFSVSMPGSARDALVTGQWDYLGRLLSAADQVAEHAKKVPYMSGFSV